MGTGTEKDPGIQTPQQGAAGRRKYEILLASVIAARATSFIFSKMLLQTMSSFNLLGIRFLLGFAFLGIVFCRKLKGFTGREILAGIGIGFMFFLTMACELTAMGQAESSLVALLENCSIIFVPLFSFLFFREKPSRGDLISTAAAMAGVFLLALQKGGLRGSFTFGLLAAACYAGAILVTSRLTLWGDSLRIGIFEVGAIGIFAMTARLLTEGVPCLPAAGKQWLMLLVQVFVCTGFGFTLQPAAQRHVSAHTAGLFCAISPAVASLLGVVVLHEHFGLLGFCGLVLILSAILLPNILKKKE